MKKYAKVGTVNKNVVDWKIFNSNWLVNSKTVGRILKDVCQIKEVN